MDHLSPKVNAIARLKFEFAYYDVVGQHVSRYATGNFPLENFDSNKSIVFKV